MQIPSAVTLVSALATLTLAWQVPGDAHVAGAASREPAPSAALGTPLTQRGSWTVYHHDDAHTGFDPDMPPVIKGKAGWTTSAMDADVYASVLIYGGLVYAVTLNNTVYAFNQTDGSLVWSNHLRAPQSSGWSCGNVSPQGILGTPVIDPATDRIYVATFGFDDLYRVEGIHLLSGVRDFSTVIPTNLGPGFDWKIEQERGALAVANGYVYVPFGGRYGDCGDYHGWVYAVPTNGGPVTDYYVTPGSGAGFWGAGGVVVDDTTGNVFVTSGNGTASGCDATSSGTPVYENDAVVRLSSTLAHEDSFMPVDWQAHWCSNDQDLGSAGPLLISPNLMFQSGKYGTGFLLNPNSLGGMDGQIFPTPTGSAAVSDTCFGNHSDETFASFAYAAPFVYVECEGHGLVALNVNTSAPSFSFCDSTCGPPDWHAGSGTYGSPIVAAGAVWVANNGGGLTAYNAATGALVYQSAGFGIERFVTPSEAGGEVFVPSINVVRQFVMGFSVSQTSPPPPPPPRSTPIAQTGMLPSPTRQPVTQSSPAPTPFGR